MLTAAAAGSSVWTVRAPLPEPRAGLLQAAVGRRLLVAGGTYWLGERKIWSARTDFFEPATNSWQAGPSLPSPRADSAVVTVSGEVFVIGGSSEGTALDDVIVFSDGKWKALPAMRLPQPRTYPVAASIGSRLYVFGGMSRPGDFKTINDEVLVWDVTKPRDGWRSVSKMPPPRRSNFGSAVQDGKVWIFGGVTVGGGGTIRNLDESWSFDPTGGEWRSARAAPVANRAWAAVSHGSDILLLGGYTTEFANQVLRFSPGPSSWVIEPRAALPHGLADARFSWIGKKLYVTGGESGNRIRSGATWEGAFD